MEKFLTWYSLLLKANLKKKTTWLALLFLILFTVLVHGIQVPDETNMVIGIGGAEDDSAVKDEYVIELLATLNAMSSAFDFVVYSDMEQLYRDAEAGKVTCAFILCEDFGEKVLSGDLDAIVTCVCTPYAAKGEVAKETFYAAFFRVYSDEILTEAAAEIFAEQDEERMAQLLEDSRAYLNSDGVFHTEEVYVSVTPGNVIKDQSLYPIQGICGLTIFLIAFLTAESCCEGKRSGLKHFLNSKNRALFMYIDGLAAATPVVIVSILLVTALQMQRGMFKEVLLFVLMGALAAAYSMVIVSLMRGEAGSVAVIVLGHLVLYPLFWDAAQYVPAVKYIRYLSPMWVLYL